MGRGMGGAGFWRAALAEMSQGLPQQEPANGQGRARGNPYLLLTVLEAYW